MERGDRWTHRGICGLFVRSGFFSTGWSSGVLQRRIIEMEWIVKKDNIDVFFHRI